MVFCTNSMRPERVDNGSTNTCGGVVSQESRNLIENLFHDCILTKIVIARFELHMSVTDIVHLREDCLPAAYMVFHLYR
jgi:hypothetical protein